MIKIFFLGWVFLAGHPVLSQSAEEYLEMGLDKARKNKLEESLKDLDKSIGLDSLNPTAWYFRGVVLSSLREYEMSLADLDQAILLADDYKQAYLYRGRIKRMLTDYTGAFQDYNYSLAIDPLYADAYYFRASYYELFLKRDSACADYTKALSFGFKSAEQKAKDCKDKKPGEEEIYPIRHLAKTSNNKKYGFTGENPVKVGSGPDGGPANQRAYLDLLRDGQGKPITYSRKGSCCGYKSEKAIFGMALVDIYEISYNDEQGNPQTSHVYISFYDYEEPMILKGFKTVGGR